MPIKLQLGDRTLLASKLWLQVREVGLDDETLPVAEPIPPADSLQANSQGFLIRSLRIVDKQPMLRTQH
ncbi:MAG: GNAT family N-acetyltransferase, partial [Nitrosospira sp.]